MRKLLLLSMFISALSTLLQSQTQVYTMYAFNKLQYNAGFAGNKDNLAIGLHYRNQWVGVDGAPKTMSLYAHTPFKDKRGAVGISYLNDQIGLFNTSLSNIYYAYRMTFENQTSLSFGLNFQWDYTLINWNKANSINRQDIAIPFDGSSKSAFNAGFGFYYAAPKYFVGLSMVNLIRTSASFIAAQDASRINHDRTIFLMSGTVFKLSSKLLLKPTILVRYIPPYPIGIDFNLNLLFMEVFWLGLVYRVDEATAISGFVRFPVTKNLNVGIGVDYPYSQFKNASKGTFEIMAEYIFNSSKKSDKVDNIRFFW